MDPSDENFRFYAYTRNKLNITATTCYNELKEVYNNQAPGKSTVFRWYSSFRDVNVATQSPSGRPSTSRTPEVVAMIEDLIRDDPRASVRDLASWCEVSKTIVHRILTEDLKLRNVASVWIPHQLTDENKQSRINCAKHIRRLFFQEGLDSFCNKLAVQDETWVYLTGQASKRSNRCWLQKDESRSQVIRRTLSDKKVLLLFAFTPNKRFSISALAPGETVNSECIINFVKHTGNLWRTLRSNPIHLSELLWQWDNARPHSSRQVKDYLASRNVTPVFQSPYSPDMNLCDRFIFSWMKSDFSKRNFTDHSELQNAALQWAKGLSEEVLSAEVQKLIDHCQLVIDSQGDYITQ